MRPAEGEKKPLSSGRAPGELVPSWLSRNPPLVWKDHGGWGWGQASPSLTGTGVTFPPTTICESLVVGWFIFGFVFFKTNEAVQKSWGVVRNACLSLRQTSYAVEGIWLLFQRGHKHLRTMRCVFMALCLSHGRKTLSWEPAIAEGIGCFTLEYLEKSRTVTQVKQDYKFFEGFMNTS